MRRENEVARENPCHIKAVAYEKGKCQFVGTLPLRECVSILLLRTLYVYDVVHAH